MTTVVTGAAGHLGGALVRALCADGRTVRALDRTPMPWFGSLPVETVHTDILDQTELRRAFEGAETVYHLAAVISIDGDRDGRIRSVNVDGASRVAVAALEAGVRRLVHCSSVHAFDLGAVRGDLNEESPRSLDDHLPAYDRSKAAGEEAVRDVIDIGLDAVIINPTGIIGPYDGGRSRMGRVFRDLREGTLPALVDGAFNWVDVRDVARAAMAAERVGTRGRNYLVPGHRTSLAELAEIAANVTGTRPPRLTAPMWLARLTAPVSTFMARVRHTDPRHTGEALHALRTAPHVDGTRAMIELGHVARPLAESITDFYADLDGRLESRPTELHHPG